MRQQSKWLVELISDKSVRAEYIEDIIAQLNLRLVEKLEVGRIDLREAENLLYNLDVYTACEKRRLSKQSREILEWGMELEDVEDQKLNYRPSFVAMKKLSQEILTRKTVGRTSKKKLVAA